MKRGLAEVSALGIAAAAAGAAYLLAAPLWAVPLAALGGWSTMRVLLALPPASSKAPRPAPLQFRSDYDAEIAEVAKASQRILALSARAVDPLVRQRGSEVSAGLNRVIAHLREDPDDLMSSQRFLAVYIERTQAIMARYIQYESLATPQAEQVRHKVRDDLLPMLIRMCEAHLHRITYDDLRSFETDVDVLWKSINLEGL